MVGWLLLQILLFFGYTVVFVFVFPSVGSNILLQPLEIPYLITWVFSFVWFFVYCIGITVSYLIFAFADIWVSACVFGKREMEFGKANWNWERETG